MWTHYKQQISHCTYKCAVSAKPYMPIYVMIENIMKLKIYNKVMASKVLK